MHTTAEYLESLQQDLLGTIDALGLNQDTNFSDIKQMAEDGEIVISGSSGDDLSEYFDYEPSTITGTFNEPFINSYVKKMPDLIVPSTITELTYITSSSVPYNLTVFPKIICGNNITSMQYMFYGGMSNYITTIDLSGLNTTNVTTMRYMFNACSNLTSLDLSNFNTKKVSNMNNMFAGCSSLTELNLSSFEGDAIQRTERMFQSCTSLTKIDMRNFTFTNIAYSSYMFGMNASSGVPDNCLIIVSDNTQKSWITSNFSRLTNVKTVDEL